MTPQEQTMIDDLVARIRSTPVADKDVDAERHLQQTLGNVPDALYVLTQTVLVQQYGLEQAQTQLQAKQDEIDALKRQQDAGAHAQKSGGSFLSRIFGADEGNTGPAAPATSAPNAGPGYQPVNYAPPAPGGYPPPPPSYGAQVYPGGGYGGPAYGSAPGSFGGGPFSGGGFGGGGGGFLRGALQTAAGVAAGAMVFQGMEDLFRGFGGGHENRGLGGMPGETVNNYYGDEGERGNTRDLAGNDDSGFYNPAHDASREDLGNDSRGFADTGSGSDTNDTGDDNSANGFDDSSDFSDNDDSGSLDGSDDSSY